jgi:pyruvate/2-oxoglutarate dehydrogenase complex dihydrolipoamide dehydrogenase (E3) component
MLMAVDYDLIVIGGSPEGIFAAATAARLNARVALVEQPFEELSGNAEAIYNRALTQTTNLWQHWRRTPMGLSTAAADFSTNFSSSPLTSVKSWGKEAIAILAEQNSLVRLASLGVDVISGSGEFCRLPEQAFLVKSRRLRSRAYLIATGSHPLVPEIDGLRDVGYWKTTDLWQREGLESLPQSVIIWGSSPSGIELAQCLQRLGKSVTLIVEDKRLLPQEEPEASALIQAQLEIEGIKILTHSSVTQVKELEGKKWLQAGNRAIEADAIVLATQRQPNIEGLNLEGVGVQWGPNGIRLNEKLQTTNPRIYGCGDVAGGHSYQHLAQYEAKLALKNALFVPVFKVDYGSISRVMFTNPTLARVGMTEAQARRRYGEEIEVAVQYFKTIAQAQLLGETTGFCKLIIRRNGQVLGAHILGYEAGEVIGAIALAINNKVKVGTLAKVAYPSLTLSEIISETAMVWQRQRLNRNQFLRNFLDDLFTWRRHCNL